MEMFIDEEGNLQCVYSEEVDLMEICQDLGEVEACRASHVEPLRDGSGWTADMAPVGGPTLGPFHLRSEALDAEREWLQRHLEGKEGEVGEGQ